MAQARPSPGPGGVIIRPERAGDHAAIRRVNTAAFEGTAEADLVDRLCDQADPYVGLVATLGEALVGHVAFSPVTLAPSRRTLDVRGLAPMAVLPEHQRRGIGSALVRAGLAACRRDGCVAVVVLGHPGYYPRFGFEPADSYGVTSEYDAPREAFMLLELVPGGLRGAGGLARYHPAFAG